MTKASVNIFMSMPSRQSSVMYDSHHSFCDDEFHGSKTILIGILTPTIHLDVQLLWIAVIPYFVPLKLGQNAENSQICTLGNIVYSAA
jgi:hypothetical protein